MGTRMIRRLVLVALVGAMLGTALPASGGRLTGRPLAEDLSGYTVGMVMSPGFPVGDTFGGRCSTPSQWVSTSSGTGVISHAGAVAWVTEHCFQLDTGTFGDARLVITAANGDRLYGTYDGFMTGETTFAETVTITGGTGRFAGASGTIDETGWFDPTTGYMEVTGTGRIVYDASARSGNR